MFCHASSKGADMESRGNLNLKQLRVFYHVGRNMSFTKAASELFITQSAVTKAIDSLEDGLGVRVFVRERGTLALTEAGSVLLSYAEKICRMALEAEEALASLAANPAGVLRLGTTKTFARYLMPSHMLAFHEAFSDVRIQMTEGSSRQLAEWIAEGHLDVAVVGRIAYPEKIFSTPFPHRKADPLVVVMNPGHHLSGRNRLTVADIAREPLLLREKGSGMRQKVLELFDRESLVPNILLEASSIDFTKEMIQRGAGIGILGLMSVEEEIGAGTFTAAELGAGELSIPIDIIFPASGYRPLAARSFLDFIAPGARLEGDDQTRR